jgi:hypothetical protein
MMSCGGRRAKRKKTEEAGSWSVVPRAAIRKGTRRRERGVSAPFIHAALRAATRHSQQAVSLADPRTPLAANPVTHAQRDMAAHLFRRERGRES